VTTQSLILIGGACVTAYAFFGGAEVAMGAASRSRLRQRAQAGSAGARMAESLQARPQIALSTTLIGSNLAIVLAAVVTAIYLEAHGWPAAWAAVFAIAPMLVVGQVVKTAMQAQSDRVVVWVAPLLALSSWLLRPLVLVVSGFAGALTRLAGTDKKKAFVTRDELAMLIETEPSEGDKPDISADEREMIANVFELSDYTVADLMVPLSEVTALDEDTRMIEAALEVHDKQHSRMPVYRSRLDDIVGIVHLFDILQAGQPSADKTVGEIARPAVYVPESMKAIDLLVALQAEGNHIAVVVDEYGGAVGIVTFEDLLETIVGDIDDEYDDEPSPIRVERPGVWRVEARTSVAKINQELDLGLAESDEYETIGGLLIEHMRHIPEHGATLTLGNVTIEVVAATDRAIEVVRIARKKK